MDAVLNALGWTHALPARPDDHVQRLELETVVPAPLHEAFAFFADASKLAAITPPSLGFRMLTAVPVVMREGLELDYRINVHGVSLPWRSRIDVWEPGVRFVDRQVIGPYLWWHHEHRFEAVPGGTRVVDRVEYVPRLRWLTGWMVRREVEAIFAYRRAALARIFAAK